MANAKDARSAVKDILIIVNLFLTALIMATVIVIGASAMNALTHLGDKPTPTTVDYPTDYPTDEYR